MSLCGDCASLALYQNLLHYYVFITIKYSVLLVMERENKMKLEIIVMLSQGEFGPLQTEAVTQYAENPHITKCAATEY